MKMTIITNILVCTYLVFSAVVSAQICNSPGQCVNSIYLGSTHANGSVDCLKICRVHEGCNFATYSPDYQPNECLLFQTCEKVDSSFCPNCVTSGNDCAQCDVTGICTGKILQTRVTSDKVSCLSWCQSTDQCSWFSYENIGNICILFETCPDFEKNQRFISGEKNCQYRQDCSSLEDPDIEWFDAKHLQFGCIGLVKTEMKAPEAENYCGSRGYRLVEIYDQNQQNFIAENCANVSPAPGSGDDFWIGLKRIQGTSTWKWLDSDIGPEFTAWGHDEPQNYNSDELLATVFAPFDYKWADIGPANNYNCKPICQKLLTET